ncbi:MAG TPA: hypothetical protein VNU75_03445, partial [Acidimicrobiales bacterium]|nr:hypothetical protein [Acidimicrobiales bacterium]
QRVLLGRRQLLLRQAADHARFDWIELHDEGEPIASALAHQAERSTSAGLRLGIEAADRTRSKRDTQGIG